MTPVATSHPIPVGDDYLRAIHVPDPAVPLADAPRAKFTYANDVAARWPGVMHWRYNHAGAPASFDRTATLAVVTAALAKWTSVCGIAVQFDGESADAPGTLVDNHADGLNVVGWIDDDPYYSAYVASYGEISPGGGVLLDSDMYLNRLAFDSSAFLGFMGQPFSDLLGTVVHEWGHMLGLGHSNIAGSDMSGPLEIENVGTREGPMNDQLIIKTSPPLVIQLVALGVTLPPPDAPTTRVVEYYNAGLDRYFMTLFADEIAALDAATPQVWRHTGNDFGAYAPGTAGAIPVCRFYLPPAAGDSHYFLPDPPCADTEVDSAYILKDQRGDGCRRRGFLRRSLPHGHQAGVSDCERRLQQLALHDGSRASRLADRARRNRTGSGLRWSRLLRALMARSRGNSALAPER